MKPTITRTIALAVLPEGERIFAESVTEVRIQDEAAGEFVEIVQPNRTEPGIAVDPVEWPALREAIDRMIGECRTQDREAA